VFGNLATTDRAPVSYTASGAAVTPPISRAAVVSSQTGGTSNFITTFLSNFEEALSAQESATTTDPITGRKKDKDGFVVEGEICVR
jgi:hypothetical protein